MRGGSRDSVLRKVVARQLQVRDMLENYGQQNPRYYAGAERLCICKHGRNHMKQGKPCNSCTKGPENTLAKFAGDLKAILLRE